MTIYVIGDSHAQIFNAISGCDVIGNRAWCAGNIPKQGKKSELISIIKNTVKPGDKLILVFGEIDCRLHVHYQSQKQGVPIDTIIDNTVEGYGWFAKEIRDMGVSIGFDVAVFNIVPAGTWIELEYQTKYKSPEADLRKQIYCEFHDKMASFCEKNGIKTIDVWDKVIGEDGFTKEGYRRDEVHLSREAVPIIVEELSRVFNLNPSEFKYTKGSPKRVYLVDLDGVVVQPGQPHIAVPGAVDKLKELSTKGEIWIFSCWAFGKDQVDFLRSLGVPFAGLIGKPLADEYVFIDDHLNVTECRTSL